MGRSIIRIGLPIALGLSLAVLGLWLLGGKLPAAHAGGPWYVDPAGNNSNTCLAPGAANACQTIAGAIGKALSGDTIIIAAGTYTENLTVNKPLVFVGAGAGSTIVDGGNTDSVFSITSGDVSISDLTVQRGNSSSLGGGIYAAGQLTLTNVAVLSNTAGNGGGLYTIGALTLTGTQFISNTSAGYGGGAYASGATTVSGGLFQDNESSGGNGGGLGTYGALTLTGTQFSRNTSAGYGGGAYAAYTATVSGGLFQSNQSGGYGGGLYVPSNGSLTLSGTQFVSNTSANGGGGAYAAGAATVSGGLFQNNQCTGSNRSGSGLFVANTLTLTGTQFISDTSASDGGGAYAWNGATVSGGLFQNNRCTGSCRGGGLYGYGSLTLSGTQFISNTSRYGGGLYAYGSLTLSGTQFIGNVAAAFGGGLVHTSGSSARLVNALFARNRAGDNGAVMYLSSTGNVVILHTTIASPTLGSGAAIYVTTGTVGITDTIVASYTNSIRRAGGTVYQDYNLLFNAPTSGTVGGGSHGLTGSPAFSNPASDDYHLASLASAAFNSGVDVGVTTDLDGKPRPYDGRFDIGCYEYDGVVYHIYLPLVLRQ